MQTKLRASSLIITTAIIALAAGCGKTEDSTATKAPAAPANQANPEPLPKAAAVPAAPAPLTAQPTVTNSAASKLAAATSNPVALTPSNITLPASPSSAPISNTSASSIPAGTPVPTTNTLATLSNDQMIQGLKDALGTGLQRAVEMLGHEGGFLTNAAVKIPMPEKLQKVETALRAMKQDKLADDFVITMNRAAEQAVPIAGPVFVNALKQMQIEDARAMLTGPDNAATQYFEKATRTNLHTQFYPIVQKATKDTGVTSAYKALMQKANITSSLGQFGSALSGAMLDKDTVDIDTYVTGKTLDGLFKMVADQEKLVRQNPVARTTDVMKSVFGALKK